MKIDRITTNTAFMSAGEHFRGYGYYNQPMSNKRKSVIGACAIGASAFYFRKPLKLRLNQFGSFVRNTLDSMCK